MSRGLRILTAAAAAAVILFCPAAATAQEDSADRRPITSVYALEIGGSSINCSYLSPLPYNGWGLGLSGAWGKRMKQHPDKLIMDFRAGIDLNRGKNPVKNATEWSAALRFSWGPSWLCRLPHGIDLTLGGALDIFGGAIWLQRNGNNPVQAMAYAGIDLTAGLSWHTHLGQLPITFADRAMLPTLGAFFAPQYGETYYEIWLGNHRDLVHFGWWGNAFGIDNHLTATLHFGRRSLVLGYRLTTRTFHYSATATQYVRNSFTIGIEL